MKTIRAQEEGEEEREHLLERELKGYWAKLEEGQVPERLLELAAKLEQARYQGPDDNGSTRSDTGCAARGISLSAVQRAAGRVADPAANEQIDSSLRARDVWASQAGKGE